MLWQDNANKLLDNTNESFTYAYEGQTTPIDVELPHALRPTSYGSQSLVLLGSQLSPVIGNCISYYHDESLSSMIFLQYHQNGRLSVTWLLEQGTYQTPSYNLQCQVWYYSFLCICVQTGSVCHYSGKLYAFRNKPFPVDKHKFDILLEPASNCPQIQRRQHGIMTSAAKDHDTGIFAHTHSLIMNEPIEDRKLIVPERQYSAKMSPSVTKAIGIASSLPSLDTSTLQPAQPYGIQQASSLQYHTLEHTWPDKLKPPSRPTNVNHSRSKAYQRAKLCQEDSTNVPPVKKRYNNINLKTGLVVSTHRPIGRAERATSMFRGTNNNSGSTSTSSDGDNSQKVESKSDSASHSDISSSAESSFESDHEPRRKPQPVQPTTCQPVHQLESTAHFLSSYGGVTDEENGNSCKSYQGGYAGSYAERRLEHQASLMEPTEESYDSETILNHTLADLEAFSPEKCSQNPLPQSYPLSQESTDQLLTSGSVLGAFNVLIEQDYGIPRLDCAEKCKDAEVYILFLRSMLAS